MGTKKKRYLTVLLLLGGGALLLVGYFTYQPPLLDRGGRNPLEAAYDFFAYSGHFTRWIWEREKRNWPSAQRERLMMVWYRPSTLNSWENLKRRSTFGLARVYEREKFFRPAAALYLQAHLNNPHYRLQAERVGRKLWELRAWKELARVCRDIKAFWPDNKETARWCGEEGEAGKRGERRY